MQKWQVFTILTENHENWKKVRKIEEIENFHFPPHFGWIGAAACLRQVPVWATPGLGLWVSGIRYKPEHTNGNFSK